MDIAKQSHWETINAKRSFSRKTPPQGIKAWFEKPPSRKIFYDIAERFFNSKKNETVIEIGCAPGDRLLEFAVRYNLVPFGVEYTQTGITTARSKFKIQGFSEDNCIFSDVFDVNFQNKYKGYFDNVISFGVIEHFTNVDDAIKAHLNILKQGGTILIMIPRLQGIYYPLTKIFSPGLLPKHNLKIMNLDRFMSLFDKNIFSPQFCGYYGVLNFGMLQGHGFVQNLFVRFLQMAQTLFNPILRNCHPFENSLTSPYLLFIGKKRL